MSGFFSAVGGAGKVASLFERIIKLFTPATSKKIEKEKKDLWEKVDEFKKTGRPKW